MKDKNIFKFLKTISKDVNSHYIPAHAASAAFFVFLSLIPILILLCGIITYTPMEEDTLLTLLSGFIPESMEGFISNIIKEVYDKSASYVSLATVAVIWSAAKGILSIMNGLNLINHSKKTKNYIILRLWASIYTIILIIIILTSLFVMVFGGVIFDLLVSELSKYFQIMYLVATLRFAVVWILLFLLFVLLYAKVPNEKMKLSYHVTGALFSATMWSLFSYLFSLYVEKTGAFSMYGSLTTLVIILLWLYFNMQFLFYGAEINRYLLPIKMEQHEIHLQEQQEKKEEKKLERRLRREEKNREKIKI